MWGVLVCAWVCGLCRFVLCVCAKFVIVRLLGFISNTM